MSLTVLSVAYPFAPVGPDAVGGAEQIQAALDAAVVAAGWRSIVVAQAGSQVSGRLEPTLAVDGQLTEQARAAARRRHREAILAVLRREPVDLIHFHGVDFAECLPDVPGLPPMLATLHLPAAWYPQEIFRPGKERLWLNPVSRTQAGTCPASPRLLAPIPNGAPVRALQARHARRGFALMLARICPEKGVHLALDAAKAAGVPLIVAGELFAYAEHQDYFAREVAPRLDALRRFVGPVGFARKRRLLSAARCLLVPALAEETSSLVAREAIACGAPVIAFRRGALPETVDDGETGFIVDDVAGMAAAIGRAGMIDPERCRQVARERFSLEAMTGRYLDLYARLAGAGRIREGAA
ncbi:glycosyltransferase [Alsobacter sp. SYSU BS001988]|jgi:glycosyltransferase involved in cell wall biosynthesis